MWHLCVVYFSGVHGFLSPSPQACEANSLGNAEALSTARVHCEMRRAGKMVVGTWQLACMVCWHGGYSRLATGKA